MLLYSQKGGAKMGEKIVQDTNLYNFLSTTMYFNQARDEKKIFKLWRYDERYLLR